jgi:hypothetical protein
MYAHYADIAGHIYLYEPGKSYEKRSDYACVLTVSWMGPSEVWVSGTKGDLDVPEVQKLLRARGVHTIHYEHRGATRIMRI